MDRAHIISSDASDVVRTRIHTPKVASFLRDVALRDMAVRATHAAYVDGRGDTYTLSLASENRKAVLTSRARVVRVSLYVSLRGNFRASLTTVALPHTRAFHPLILPLPESRALIQVTESRVFAPSATGRVCHIDTGRSQRGHCVASWLGASDDQSGSGVRSSLLKGLNGARGENVITPRI